jgi:hypothetical protein
VGDRAEFVLGISQQEVLLQVSAFVRFLSLSLSLSLTLCFVFSSSRSFDEEALFYLFLFSVYRD